MRITIIQGAFLPVPAVRGGAVEKMWARLGEEFAGRGHTVTQLSRLCDGLPETETRGGVRHVRLAGYDQPGSGAGIKWRDLLYSRRAARLAPAADIAVTNTFFAPLLLRGDRGAIYVDVQRLPKGQMRLYGRAARLRANSEAVRAAILREAPGAAGRVRVIPNPLPFATPRAVDWAAKERTVLFVGRIHPEKGIELLLGAWARARESGALENWKLKLIGPADAARGGGGEAWARGLREKFARADVEWRGPVFDEEELHRERERAAVFGYPSLAEGGETFGVAVLEAMAWGATPVVSDLACFRDFVRAGENGIVFDHRGADAAEQLAAALTRAAAAESRRLGETATAVRQTHEAGVIAENFLADFATLISRP